MIAVNQFIINCLATLTLLGQVLIAVLIILIAIDRFIPLRSSLVARVLSFFGKNALACAFVIASIAMAGSLFYSEIVGYNPCKLCWYQRICMYPQVLLLGIAGFKRDLKIALYSGLLALIGAGIAAYHYSLQFTKIFGEGTCASGGGVSCTDKFIAYYGYITIPLMALTAFILIVLFMRLGAIYKSR